MNLHDLLQQEINEVEKEFKAAINGQLIKNNVVIPPFPYFKLRLLLLLLISNETEKKDRTLYALATTLIQIGLDLHNEKKETEKRQKQLAVLAGDFLSSKFYFILAKHSKNQIIKKLADGIKKINIAKTDLFKMLQSKNQINNEILNYLLTIESELLLKFIDIDNKHGKEWESILNDMLILNLIKNDNKFFLEDFKKSISLITEERLSKNFELIDNIFIKQELQYMLQQLS